MKEKQDNPNRKEQTQARAPRKPSNAPTEKARLSRGRLWLFRIIAFVILPLFFLGVIELGLRLAGYGYSTSFFKPMRIGDQDYFVENDSFGLRFFPPALARSPSPIVMKAKKPPNSCRIFILGESAALGDPRPAYGAGRYLQALLREKYPGAEFEVICVAMTAINSHVLVPIARECAQHEGDIWIIYMGNNEMVGPFGATTVFGSQSPPWQYVRLSLAIQSTRLGQWLMSLGRKMTGSARKSEWAGMKMFMENRLPPQDHRKEVVYHNFEKNLSDILKAGHNSGAALVLNTVAVNLKDCPPFASLSNSNLILSGWDAFQRSSQQGTDAQTAGQFAQATKAYDQALSLDPQFAELQYKSAQCWLQLTNLAAARTHFQAACDTDALPFRTDSRINALTTAATNSVPDLRGKFFDAAGYFARTTAAGVPGEEVFYEHVHFNFDGNYHLGLAWADQVQAFLPPAILQSTNAHTSASWASQEICEQRLGLTDWNRVSVLQDMLHRLNQPPFTTQLDNSNHLARLRAQIRELQAHMDVTAVTNSLNLYLDAIQRAPFDHRLYENFAEFLEQIGSLNNAAMQWAKVSELLPHHHLAYFEMGRLLALQGKLTEAEPPLVRAVTLRPDLAEGWLELGMVHELQGRDQLALKEYERERDLVPTDHRPYYHIGKLFSKMNRRGQAIAQLRECLRLKPDYWQGHYALGEELAFDHQLDGARAEFEEVIRLHPDYSMAHFNLAVALVQLNQLGAAEKQFEETLRLDPQNRLAREDLEKISKRRPAQNPTPQGLGPLKP